MSYEYKEKIKEDLEYSLEGVSIDYYSSEELIHKQKVKELDNVYSQAAKADEYEAKAKAFDRIVEEVNSAGKTMYKKESLVQYAVDNAFWNIDGIIVDYESGVRGW